MHVFHLRYRNTQGTLMRILSALFRRTIDLAYVQAEPSEHAHKVTLLVDVNAKQVGQLCRDWRAIVDVLDVRPASRSKNCGTSPCRHTSSAGVGRCHRRRPERDRLRSGSALQWKALAGSAPRGAIS